MWIVAGFVGGIVGDVCDMCGDMSPPIKNSCHTMQVFVNGPPVAAPGVRYQSYYDLRIFHVTRWQQYNMRSPTN